jgi:membrane protein YdbS with pleckstrin-like domain
MDPVPTHQAPKQENAPEAGLAASPGVPVPPPPEETQEVDVWWGSCAGRTMLPSFVLCGLLTAGIAAGAGYAWLDYGLPPLEVRYSAYAVAGIIWVVQVVRWGLRVLGMSYRLTNRRLFLARSFTGAPFTQVDLRRVARVEVRRSALQRRLGIGRLEIGGEDGGAPFLVLEGVADPERIAEEIRILARKARERSPAGAGCPPAPADEKAI